MSTRPYESVPTADLIVIRDLTTSTSMWEWAEAVNRSVADELERRNDQDEALASLNDVQKTARIDWAVLRAGGA